MAEFLYSFKRTIAHEGGWVNNPNDAGGETFAGISRKYWPSWLGWPIIERMKPLRKGQRLQDSDLESLVRVFYRQQFWSKIQGDAIRSQRVADILFDWAVNSGISAAITTLQKVLKVEVDGRIGNNTLAHINAFDEDKLFLILKEERRKFYYRIVEHNQSQSIFLKGWLRRLETYI